MANNLPNDLLQQLAARGIITQAQAQGNNASPPSMAGNIDASNANFQGAFAQMSPAEKQAALASATQGTQAALNNVGAPKAQLTTPTAQPAASQGVFAPASMQDQGGEPFRLLRGGGGGGGGAPSGGTAISTVSPQTREMMNNANRHKLAAADQAAAAEQQGATAEEKQLEGISDTLADTGVDMQQREELRRRAYDKQQGDYDKIRREADEGVIRPENVGFMGHIAMALGAGGAALSGAPNFAMQNINKRIDDSIATQRMNLENKRKGAEQAREGLGEMRARFGDDRTAEAAERARQLEQAKATGDVLVAQSKSPMLAAKWAGIRAGIEGEQAQMHATMEKWLPAGVGGSNVDAEAKRLYYQGYGKPGNSWDAAYAAALRANHRATGGTEPIISSNPKGGGGAMSPRLARRMADLDASDKAAARLEAHLNKPGGSLSPAEREQAKSDATILRNAGYTNIPEDPLTVFSMSGARAQGVGEVRRNIANERAALRQYGTGGAEEPGAEGEPDADSFIRPAGAK